MKEEGDAFFSSTKKPNSLSLSNSPKATCSSEWAEGQVRLLCTQNDPVVWTLAGEMHKYPHPSRRQHRLGRWTAGGGGE